MTVAWQESGWQTDLTSSAGAYGVGQIMPATGVWLANDVIGIPTLSREVVDDNIRMTVRYLKWLENYLGSQDLAIAGYYQGPGATSNGKMYSSTVTYVANVKAQLNFFERS
jgi:soluble lytic murein transglycosylase-like protein